MYFIPHSNIQAITFLQSAHRLKSEEEISCNDIIEMAGVSKQFVKITVIL